jgi:hypothetical protein
MQVPPDLIPHTQTGRPKLSLAMGLVALFFCCGLPGLIGYSVHSFFSGGKHNIQEALCLQNLRAVANAQAMYSLDNSGHLPPAEWMDATLPYLKENVGAIGCPRARDKKKEEYGYAMNEKVVGTTMASLGDLNKTPLVFDSTLLQRNAVGSTSTFPDPGRHRREEGDESFSRNGNCVVFAAGNARWTDKRDP